MEGPVHLYYYACQGVKASLFPSISVTGDNCELCCAHCNKQYLKHMMKANTPELLYDELIALWKRGGKGALISGGSNKEGVVPIEDFLPVIKQIKEDTGLFINVHPGLADKSLCEKIKDADVDTVSIDIIGDETTIRDVYHLDKKPEDYINTLMYCREVGLDVRAHVTIGLNFGSISGEYNALEMIKKAGLDSVVFLVIIPTKHTNMATINPPALEEIKKVFSKGKELFSQVTLGCMRPHGKLKQQIEELAIKEGITHIAMPSRHLEQVLEKKNTPVTACEGCCVCGPTQKM